jgi:hypothetical protein
VIYDVFKAYKRSQVKEADLLANLKEGTPGYRIFQKPQINEVDFDYTKAKEEKMENVPTKRKQHKYFVNPEPNWGPKPRATGK